jgi:hypothetical protein
MGVGRGEEDYSLSVLIVMALMPFGGARSTQDLKALIVL